MVGCLAKSASPPGAQSRESIDQAEKCRHSPVLPTFPGHVEQCFDALPCARRRVRLSQAKAQGREPAKHGMNTQDDFRYGRKPAEQGVGIGDLSLSINLLDKPCNALKI